MTGAVFIHGKCNYGCAFCDADKLHKNLDNPDFITKMEMEANNNILFHEQNGVDTIEISGNDPGDYPNIINFVKYLKTKFKYVILSTHGMTSSTMLDELYEAGLDKLRFPVYGHTEEIATKTIKQKETIKPIKTILQQGKMLLNPHIGITSYNYKYLVEMFDFILDNSNGNIEDIFIHRILSSSSWDYFIPMDKLRPEIQKLYNYIESKKLDILIQCELENCLVTKIDHMFNPSGGPELGKQQYADNLKSDIKNIPVYRRRLHVDGCEKCYLKNDCDGMLKMEYEKFGDLTSPF